MDPLRGPVTRRPRVDPGGRGSAAGDGDAAYGASGLLPVHGPVESGWDLDIRPTARLRLLHPRRPVRTAQEAR
ncbi:MAG: hypothetical protein AVDCRST_MAG66-4154 [uncultured Pseudonocardia sp.]|uniref:Uncharacterized protein n=1 Tax=uncultured Pseudonocardia sp. TaxID=211455 RepID=A0A6J4QF96_9PSEU|nr:MAG: hypothetical protein AVDCRST_MAG66-4154 [uncultured Pseudonocardia sp.]